MREWFLTVHEFWLVLFAAVIAAAFTAILFRAFEFWSLKMTPLSMREAECNQKIEDLKVNLENARNRISSLEMLVQYLVAELQIRGNTDADTDGTETIDNRCSVMVAVGPDRMLDADLSAFRSVASRTPLRFQRLRDVTRDRFERFLERHRKQGRPIRYVHLAVHANPDGVQFADGMVDGVWLSERLRDVHIVVVDGCEATFVGDFLGVVPWVVTMMEPIDNHDAMLFAEAFWCEIGNGAEPDAAFYSALDRCPPVVSEFAELHT